MNMGRQPFQAIWDGLALAAWLVDAKSLQILQANEAAVVNRTATRIICVSLSDFSHLCIRCSTVFKYG